ncbi:circularly permuted type 2 ATP-grasp protein [Patulibacter sp. SYSU D01012]|uniref:circularly permuted type 2 ATP-grasp protein n=1 Tax=Patulibacter sp. SYSU D01012 TaxID=2817381 RepID=UPI0032BF79CF
MTTGPAPTYEPPSWVYDEAVAGDGRPREHVARLMEAVGALAPEQLAALGRRRDRTFIEAGITFDTIGPDGQAVDRPFPLDLVPRVIPASDWSIIKRGLAQRIRALNAFIDDVYHGREMVREGLIPWRLVVSRSHFARQVDGVRPPGGVYTHVAGLDLVRDNDGTWRVLEDNVRTPSGISYVLANRQAMTRLAPRLFQGHRVRPVDHYPQVLLEALRAVAPADEGEATVVVWTPGPLNPAYFEHAFLAHQMGVELVQASDLVVRGDVCYMRTTRGLQRVHAIYRRLDDEFCDPIDFRPDSVIGVPGLLRAYRAGTVAVANAFGTGVADDKAIYPYVPDMIRYYLGEEPILQNVPTYRLDRADEREHVLGRLDELVVKPTSESGGKGVVIGPHASPAELEEVRAAVLAEPGRYIAQELVRLSTVPTVEADGTLAPRHVDLRPFAVFGETIRVIPGGLTRVAMTPGSMLVNSSMGGGSKDTWVLESDGPAADADVADGPEQGERLLPALPEIRWSSAWVGQAQQQQQDDLTAPDGDAAEEEA